MHSDQRGIELVQCVCVCVCVEREREERERDRVCVCVSECVERHREKETDRPLDPPIMSLTAPLGTGRMRRFSA